MNFNSRSNYISGNVIKNALITIIALLNLTFFCADKTVAQLDSTFGANGVAATNVVGVPVGSFLLPDGKILVVSDNFTIPVRFARFNSDGTPDTTYGTGGVVEPVMPFVNQNNGHIYTAVRQADGKIVLAGIDNEHGIITRFTENGTLDTSFANNGVNRTNLGEWDDYFDNLILQPDGKIVGVGPVTARDLEEIFVIRYSADGILDQTFGNGNGYMRHVEFTGFNTSLVEMKVLRQSDGKLLAFYKLTSDYDGSARIRRFNADGTFDNTYPSISLHGSSKLALQSDDKLLVARVVDKNDALDRQQSDISILRYTTSGSLDTSFGTNGIANLDITSYFDDRPKALMVLPDGQILVSVLTVVPLNRSAFRGSKISLARLSADGTAVTGKFLQTSASAHISYSYSFQNGDSFLTIQPDGKILTTYHWGEGFIPNTRLLLTRAVSVPVQTYRFHGLPFDFTYSPSDIKATAEATIFRPSTQKWYRFGDGAGYFFGLSTDIPVPSDYVGNFETDLAVFRPSNGTWLIARTKVNAANNYITVQWGLSGDIPAPADYDGDGKSDITVFRPSNGAWYIRNSSDNSMRGVQWGLNGDKPVAGDYDGDGLYDVAVWRPSDGTWYILRSSDGQASFINFGSNGDVPVQEDFDGDGITDIAVWRPSTGVWYVLQSSNGNLAYFYWGNSTDIATPADYDGDLKADFAVWRPAIGRWYIYRSSDSSIAEITWGVTTDIPVQGRN